ADLVQVPLVGPESPFWIQGQADVGETQQFLVTASLGQEVGPSRLQIEDYIDACLRGGVDPRPDLLHSQLGRIIAVGAGRGGGGGGDDLEYGENGSVFGGVLLGETPYPVDRLFDRLLA